MLNQAKKGIIGKVLLLLTTVIWGSSFIILKDTLDKLGNGHFKFFILAARFLIAVPVIGLIGFGKIKKMSKNTFMRGVILGAILFCAYAVQTWGLENTTASENAFLTASYCMMTPFLAWIFIKKRPSAVNVISAILCLCGIALVALIGKDETAPGSELLGNALSVSCGFFYALQIVFIDKYSKEDDPVCLLFIELLTTAILFSILTAVAEFPIYYADFSIDGEAVWKILYLGLVATCFAQFGQMYGQKSVSHVTAALILSLEGVFAVIFDLILGGTTLTVFMIIGFVIIFIAEILNEIITVVLRRRQNIEKNVDSDSTQC